VLCNLLVEAMKSARVGRDLAPAEHEPDDATASESVVVSDVMIAERILTLCPAVPPWMSCLAHTLFSAAPLSTSSSSTCRPAFASAPPMECKSVRRCCGCSLTSLTPISPLPPHHYQSWFASSTTRAASPCLIVVLISSGCILH
jgi:hypothetical protein